MEREIIKLYDSIIYELFIVMLVILIYLLLCHQWIISIVFGLLVLGAYITTSKKIKEMKKALG